MSQRKKVSIMEFVTCEPGINSGWPSVGGVCVSVIFDRFEAGESLTCLAHDYNVTDEAVREAITFECGRRFTWRREAVARRGPS